MLIFRPVCFAIFLTLICGFVLNGNKAHAQNVMRIAAVVNDDVITQQDLGERVKLTIATARLANTPEVRRRIAQNVLRTMIDEQLKSQQAAELEINVSDKQLQAGFANWARSVGIPSNQIDNALTQLKVDKVILEDSIRAEIGWGIAVRRLGRERMQVSEKELNNALAAKLANKGKPEYRYSEIFLPVNTPRDQNTAQQLATRLYGFLQNGSRFAAIARDFSQSPSAVRGGDLGWIQTGQMDGIVEQVLQTLKPGQYSRPLRVPSGFMIVSLADKRIAGEEDQDEILSLAQIPFPLPKGAGQDQVAQITGIARTLLSQANSCENLVEQARAQGFANASQTNDLKLSNLPAELRDRLKPLTEGQSTITLRKNIAVVALRLCSRAPAPAKPEVTKRKEFEAQLVQEKFGREARRILQKLRRNAFVDVRL